MEDINNIINERLYSILVFFFYVFLIIILFRVIIVLATSPNKKEYKERKHSFPEKNNFNYIKTDKTSSDNPDFEEDESWREELISFYLENKKNKTERYNSLYKEGDKLCSCDLLCFDTKTRNKETVLNLIKDNNQLTKTKRKKNKLKEKETKEDNLRIFKDNFLKKAN